MTRLAVVGLAVVLFTTSCKSIMGETTDAGPPSEISLTTVTAAPLNAHPAFAVEDEVAVVRDDGTFEIEAAIAEVGGPIVYVDPTNTEGTRGWMPVGEAKALSGSEKRSGRGYKVRLARAEWVPGGQVFPVPWLGAVAGVKVGDTFYERRGRGVDPTKCVATEVPAVAHTNVYAKCAGDDHPRSIARKAMIATWHTPVEGELKPGDIVYFDKTSWVLVLGPQGDRIIIRQPGTGARDKAVLLSTLEAVR